jgi:hypothetical protein
VIAGTWQHVVSGFWLLIAVIAVLSLRDFWRSRP